MDTTIRKRSFSVDEYQEMGRAGILSDAERIELIEGEIIEMSPTGYRHSYIVDTLTDFFVKHAVDDAMIRVKTDVVVATRSQPVPDLVVYRGPRRRYRDAHPDARRGDILLVIEVSSSSLKFDRSVKVPLYARSGIPEAWIVDIPNKRVVMFAEPQDGAYSSVKEFGLEDELRADVLGEHVLPVRLLLE